MHTCTHLLTLPSFPVTLTTCHMPHSQQCLSDSSSSSENPVFLLSFLPCRLLQPTAKGSQCWSIFWKPFVDKKNLCWHSRVENMCQWHPSQTPWERKWEAKRENNWKMRYYVGRALCGRGKAPVPPAHVCSFYSGLFITSQSTAYVDLSASFSRVHSAGVPSYQSTPVSLSHCATHSRCFLLMSNWRRRERV